MGDTTKRQIKKGSPEDNVKKKFLDTNPLFKLENKVKKHLKEKLEEKKKPKGSRKDYVKPRKGSKARKDLVPGLVQPPRRKPRKPSDPVVFKRKNDDRGNERSIDVMKERMKRKSGMNEGGMVIVDRNYLKGK